jgi:hypothetical protein
MPHQFARIAYFVVGCAMIAGVHSTVWIFAISAAVTRRALSKSRSSDQSGFSAARRSAIALCSRVKSVCRSARPSQKLPATPVRSILSSRSRGRWPSGSSRSRPPSPARSAADMAGSLP